MGAIPLGGVRLDLRRREIPCDRLDLPLLRRQLEVHGRQTTAVKALPILAALLALAACGGTGARSPEAVARAWSAALDRSDDGSAARLFADGAQIVQNGELTLRDHADAVTWNEGLPCGGRITSVQKRGRDEVLVVFVLTERPGHRCDAPGQMTAALFRVVGGKIVLWHQTPAPAASSGNQIV